MPQPGNLKDPLALHRFAVEIDGITTGTFDECNGLEGKMETHEYKEGGLNGYSHKLPGPVTFTNITLKWGTTDSTALWDWFNRVISKKDKSGELKAVSIVQYNSMHNEVQRWNLAGAFPLRWAGPGFNAAQSNVTIEQLELAFGELTLVRRKG